MPDNNCPFREYLFDNAMWSSRGAFRCISRGRQPTDASMRYYDFPICSEVDKSKCSWYQNHAPKNLELSLTN